ncbi:hypothetical protein C7Y46_01460 [Bacillus safensis]|nr:hypothetical protein C7Y46_01460 [Bacillus sp. SDF0016]
MYYKNIQKKTEQLSACLLVKLHTFPLKIIKNVQTTPFTPFDENRAFEHMKLQVVQSLLA